MKQVLFVLLSLIITNSAWAQGVTKNGKITTTGSEYVNKNGAIGSAKGVDKNGKIVVAVALPDVITNDITLLNSSGATSGATITYTGTATVIAKGLCWSATANPTVALSTKTTETADITSFSSDITGLTAKTKYYMRAYITTSDGTAYGDQLVFNTIVPGDDFEGGKVGFVFTPGFVGYNKNVQKAYIARELGGSNNKLSTASIGVITSLNHGTGSANTQAIIKANNPNDQAYAARKCADLSIEYGGIIYNDWFLPSKDELAAVLGLRAAIGVSNSNNGDFWMTSSQSQNDAGKIWWWRIFNAKSQGMFYESGETTWGGYKAVAIRISSAL